MALLASAGVASADFTFPTFQLGPDVGAVNTWQNLNMSSIASIPAGNYVGFSMLIDWQSVNNSPTNNQNAWSNEARVQFASAAGTGTSTQPTVPGGTTVHRVTTESGNDAGNANNINNMLFSGPFGTAFNGTTPFFLNFRQTFASFTTQDITWANIRLTLLEPAPPVPGDVQATAIDLGTLEVGGMLMTQGTLPSQTTNLMWHKFTIDTPVSASDAHAWLELMSNDSGFDTEIGLYDSAGNLLDSDDDDGFGAQSVLSYGAGSGELLGGTGTTDTLAVIGAGQDGGMLAAGEYYVVIGGFNTVFGASNFSVTAGTATGDFKLTIVPAPGALALLGLGGLVAARRRRA